MRDLTKDSITSHILTMAAPVAIGLLSQFAYQLVNLYFISRIGPAAVAGMSAAGSLVFVVSALLQVLSSGAVARISHAVGAKDEAAANLIFNQSLAMSGILAMATMVALYFLARPYLHAVAADADTAGAGITYIFWVLPGYALMLPMAVLAAALRGVGIVRPTVAFYMLSVIINLGLAPLLISDDPGMALGIRGAGLATSISTAIGTMALAIFFGRLQPCMSVRPELMHPRFNQWIRILSVGLPTSGESVILFCSAAVVYCSIRDFGAAAQAGFATGSLILQAVLLPGVSIGVAVCSIAGQNFGAKNLARVREAFRRATFIGILVMVSIGVIVHWGAERLVAMFGAGGGSNIVAVGFLRLTSWGMVAQELVYLCSAMFQGLGNTTPIIISCVTYISVFSMAAAWLSMQPEFQIEQMWYVSIASIAMQAAVSLSLLRIQLRGSLPVNSRSRSIEM